MNKPSDDKVGIVNFSLYVEQGVPRIAIRYADDQEEDRPATELEEHLLIPSAERAPVGFRPPDDRNAYLPVAPVLSGCAVRAAIQQDEAAQSSVADTNEWPHGKATLAAATPKPTYDENPPFGGRSGGFLLYCHVYEARWAALKSREYCPQWNQVPPEVKEQWETLAANIATEVARKAPASATSPSNGPLTLDTERQVFFYEQDHYYLSNFSAFRVRWKGLDFATSEQAYQWEKFPHDPSLQKAIQNARSAHDAFKLAEHFAAGRRAGWDDVKVNLMHGILVSKAEQHEYVRRKLLQTGERELIEHSWRDPFWGWGPDRDGQNMLGKLWMEVRAELRARAEGRAP